MRIDAGEMLYVGAVGMLLDIDVVGMFIDIGVFCVNELAASERRLFVVYKDRG